MKVINAGNNNYKVLKAVGLGNFDGLHIGHMALVNTLINEAKSEGVRSMVYTFRQHPENVLSKGNGIPLLTSIDKKVELLTDTSLDFLYFDEFDEQYSRMQPEDFVKNVLVKKLKARVVVAGFNYRFGYRGSGSLELLGKLGYRYGYKLIVIPPVKVGDKVVSSTLIRSLLLDGEICTATKCLGRYYSIAGKVKQGSRRGTGLGFPTANMQTEDRFFVPARGVYVTQTRMEGEVFGSITNIGINPTFGDSGQPSVETHILDYRKNIYKKNIEVFFIKRIRGEIRFTSVEKLKEHVERDISIARTYHSGADWL